LADPYLDLAAFRLRSIMPPEDIDALELREQGWVTTKLEDWTDEINARCRKRYAVPFGEAGSGKRVKVPPTVLRWLTVLATRDCYFARGSSPTSEQDKAAIVDAADKVEAEIKEAADSKDGLFDLPLNTDDMTSGITKGGPQAYNETSPYVWMDRQAEVGKADDDRGAGS
jgi:hypothetical protein